MKVNEIITNLQYLSFQYKKSKSYFIYQSIIISYVVDFLWILNMGFYNRTLIFWKIWKKEIEKHIHLIFEILKPWKSGKC